MLFAHIMCQNTRDMHSSVVYLCKMLCASYCPTASMKSMISAQHVGMNIIMLPLTWEVKRRLVLQMRVGGDQTGSQLLQ